MRAVIEAPVLRRLNGTTTAALFLIVLLYFTAVFNVVVPWFNYSVSGATHLLVLSCTTAIGFYCYLACVFVDPGRVPKGWQPDLEEPNSPTLQEVKSDGSHRYCAKCESYKPPRTHHCRRCGRCVLRMDHHCIWVNNCIGQGNYRCFLLMCIYLAAAAVHAAGLLYCYDLHLLSTLSASWQEERRARRAAALLRRAAAGRPGGGGNATAATVAAAVAGMEGSWAPRFEWQGPFWVHAAAQVAASAVALPVSLALMALLLWNLHLLLHNKTTVEYHEGVRLQSVSGASPAAAPPSSSRGHLEGLEEGVASGGAAVAAAAGSTPAIGISGEPSSSAGVSPLPPAAAPLLLKSSSPRSQPQRQQRQGQQGQALRGQGPSGALAVRRLKKGQHPYDLGPLDNLHEVCGDWEALWCLPVRNGAAGSGLAFATRQGQRQRGAAAAVTAI